MDLIRKTTDCTLRCLVVLAEAHGKQAVSVPKLAQEEDISEDLLHKVMWILARAKVVQPERGRTGGFRLAKPAEQTSVLEVLEILQGPFVANRCFLSSNRRLANKFVDIQKELLSLFRGLTIADLVHTGSKQKRRRGHKGK